MAGSAPRTTWDVTFLFPGGKCSLFRCIHLRNIVSLCDLTHEAAESFFGRLLPTPHEDDDTLLPGFIVYHVPVKENQHLGFEALQPTIASWHSLCQRQPSGNRSLYLQVVPKNSPFQLEKNPRRINATVNSTSDEQVTDYKDDLHVKSLKDDYQYPAYTHENVKNSDIPPHSSLRGFPLLSPKWDCDSIAEPSAKMNRSPRPCPPEALANFVKRGAPRSTFSYTLSSNIKKDQTNCENAITVRMFALQFVITQIHFFLSSLMQEVTQRDVCDKNGVMCLSSDVIVYLSAAIVKEWQNSVSLRYDAMNEPWGSLPPLLQNAQLEYLQCIVSRQLKRLRAELLGNSETVLDPQPPSFEGYSELNHMEPVQTVQHQEAEGNVWGITEVTYCSASGPLPLPKQQSYVVELSNFNGNNNTVSYGLTLTLTAPPFISFLDELAVVGRVYSSHRVGLFWWILDETDESSAPVILPLSDWYHHNRITTFEITPQTFTLTVQSGSLQAGHRYRLIAQVCDVVTGECASSALQLDGGDSAPQAFEADNEWAVAVSRAN